MHRREFAIIGIAQEEIERLRLANVGSAVRRHINKRFLLDFPDRLKDRLDIRRYLSESDDRAVIPNNRVFHFS